MTFNLQDLDPALQPLYTQWLAACTAQGLSVKGTTGFRAPAVEDELHAEGKTPATSKTCEHCHVDGEGNPASRAFDFSAYDANGNYITDGTNDAYTQAGKIAESLSDEAGNPLLKWGAHFPTPDYDHIQLA